MLSAKNFNLTKQIVVVDDLGVGEVWLNSVDLDHSGAGRGLGFEVDLIKVELFGTGGVNSQTIIVSELTLGLKGGHGIISGNWENGQIGGMLL